GPLKPAARALAAQRWAIKQESPDAKGVGELLHLAASGRTSIPVDKETPKALYRTAGYRICGERAVRVDILERLADLIRPALSWREGAPGTKPDGFFDGRSFVVTGAMTSLTGASGEDFASILRSLGYRMDRRLKPAEATSSALTNATADAASNTTASAATEAAPTEVATSDGATAAAVPAEAPAIEVTSRSLLPEPQLVSHEASPAQAPQVLQAPVDSTPADVAIATPAELAPPAADAAQPATTAAPKSAEEAAFIEVWRPAGRSERRPHRPRRPHRTPAQAGASAEAGTAAPAGMPAEAVVSAPDGAPSLRSPRRPR